MQFKLIIYDQNLLVVSNLHACMQISEQKSKIFLLLPSVRIWTSGMLSISCLSKMLRVYPLIIFQSSCFLRSSFVKWDYILKGTRLEITFPNNTIWWCLWCAWQLNRNPISIEPYLGPGITLTQSVKLLY